MILTPPPTSLSVTLATGKARREAEENGAVRGTAVTATSAGCSRCRRDCRRCRRCRGGNHRQCGRRRCWRCRCPCRQGIAARPPAPPPDRGPRHVVCPWIACSSGRGRADGRRALTAPPLPVLLVVLGGCRRRRGGEATGTTSRGRETAAHATATSPTATAAVALAPDAAVAGAVAAVAVACATHCCPDELFCPTPPRSSCWRPRSFGQCMHRTDRRGTG